MKLEANTSQSDGEYEVTMCYPITRLEQTWKTCRNDVTDIYSPFSDIDKFLIQPNVRDLIGVDPSLPTNFTGCNMEVLNWFGKNHDRFFPAQYYIAALLERGIRALIYVGANDWVCNWVRCPPSLFASPNIGISHHRLETNA